LLLAFLAVDETVVARGTLEVDAEERLRNALRELHLVGLARRNFAPPADALDESLGSRLGRDQLADHLVVRFVGQQAQA